MGLDVGTGLGAAVGLDDGAAVGVAVGADVGAEVGPVNTASFCPDWQWVPTPHANQVA